MQQSELSIKPLNHEAFKDFGDVIETDNQTAIEINNGNTKRFHDLAKIDVIEDGGRPLISIFRSKSFKFPINIKMMERHPLSSQAFIPFSVVPFLVVVANSREKLAPSDLHVFMTNGLQGVNYHRGIWHHPLIALRKESDFMVVDRGGDGENCEEYWFDESHKILVIDNN